MSDRLRQWRHLLGVFHVAVPLVDAPTRRSLRAYVPFTDVEIRQLIQEGHERKVRGERVAVWNVRSLSAWMSLCTGLCLLLALVGSLLSWSGFAVPLLILGAMVSLRVSLARGHWYVLDDPRALDYAMTVKESLVRETFNATHFKSLIELRHLRREQAHSESMRIELEREMALSPPELAERLRLESLHFERFGAVADEQIAQLRLEQAEARSLQLAILNEFNHIRLRLRTADTEAVLLHARDSALAAELTIAAAELHVELQRERLAELTASLTALESRYRRYTEAVQLSEAEQA